jgi:hypothetical protein
MFATPRPVPSTLVPFFAGSAVIALALPVFLLADWGLDAWGLAAALWVGAHALDALLTRLPLGAGNLAASGVVGIGRTFRAVAVGVVLIAVAASDARLAVAAALLYALAYTLELALSLATYFGTEAKG